MSIRSFKYRHQHVVDSNVRWLVEQKANHSNYATRGAWKAILLTSINCTLHSSILKFSRNLPSCRKPTSTWKVLLFVNECSVLLFFNECSLSIEGARRQAGLASLSNHVSPRLRFSLSTRALSRERIRCMH